MFRAIVGTSAQVDCREVMREKEAAWLQWRAEGQRTYLAQLSQVDQEYAKRLQSFEADAAANQRAYEAFQQDEQSKAGWVHCPHCNALWEGSDACPSVTCGTLEAAMGQKRAVGVGCGRAFRLTEGKKYQPVTAPPPQPAAARPDRPAAVVHQGVACDRCGISDISGIRIRCLHCPNYNLCLPCLAEHGPDHDAEEEWPGREQAPHIFEVLHEPANA
jgi:hypothetical protein